MAGPSDRELVGRIVARAVRELEDREAAFRRLGLDSMADVDALRQAGEPVPCGRLVLVIDGWAQLKRDFDEHEAAIEELLGRGLTYGLHVVVAAGRWAEMRPNISDNLGARLELRLNDPLDSQIDRKAAARVADGIPGRGLTRGAREFQAALPSLDASGIAGGDPGAALARAVAQIAARWPGAPADPVLVLPRRVMRDEIDAPGAVFAVDEERLEPLRIELDGPDAHLLVLGDGESGRTNLLRAFAEGVAGDPAAAGAQIIVIDPRRTLVDLAGLDGVVAHASTQATIVAALQDLALAVNERAARLEQAPGSDPGAPLVLVVDDYDLLATPEGNPLAGLAGALAYGRDLRLHVVVARRVAGCMRASFEPFLQKLFELRTPVLLFSGDPSEGPVVDGVRARALPPGRAQLVRRGRRPVLVQTILAPPRLRTAPAPAPDPHRHLRLAAGGMQ